MTTVKNQRTQQLAKVKVLRREDLTDDLQRIWLEKPEGYTFKPGQYCTIGIDGIERAYSIVSAPHEEHLELFIELVPLKEGGVLTPLIWDLHVGDSVTIRPRAKGIFVFKPEYKNHLMVATVTGVVPYISIIRDYLHNKREGHRFYVLFGASYQHELTFDEELSQLASEHPDLVTYVSTISRPNEEPNAGWTGEAGRVNNLVEKYTEQFGLSSDDTLIYGCGHPGMIEDIKDRMIPHGWDVEEERFWKDD